MRRLGLVILLALGLVVVVATAPFATVGTSVAVAHPEPGDIDGDGVRDERDNCPRERNGNQSDVDRDTLGDRCDTDADADGVLNPLPYPERGDPAKGEDNCAFVPNPGQEDTGSSGNPNNGIGDACDRDDDGDGINDARDNCLGLGNPGQDDYDYDRVGDACDPDQDEDGEFDATDNCDRYYNPLQEDLDGDGLGTPCDPAEAAGGSGGSGGGSDSSDRTAPAVRMSLAGVQRIRELGRELAVRVRCSEECTVTARLTVDRRTSRRLKAGRRGIIASGAAALGGQGSTYVFMRFRKGVPKRVARLGAVRATLTLAVADTAGNRDTSSRKLRLRR